MVNSLDTFVMRGIACSTKLSASWGILFCKLQHSGQNISSLNANFNLTLRTIHLDYNPCRSDTLCPGHGNTPKYCKTH